MKKVLYITNLPSPYKVAFFNLLSKAVDLKVVYEREKASDRDARWIAEEKRDFKEIFLDGKKVGNEASFSFRIIKLIKGEKFDIVMMNGYSSPTAIIAISYMKIHHIPYAISCDGMMPSASSNFKAMLKRFLIKDASYYLSSGKICDEQLIQFGAKASKIYRYPFSSVLEKDVVNQPFDKKKYKSIVGASSKIMLLFVGQFIDRKGLDLLFQSVLKLKDDFQLFMVGGSKEQASKYPGYDDPRIIYCGFKSKEELKSYYLASDALLLPTRFDAWGLVVNESLSSALPVITTNKCGAGLEMIKDGYNGFLSSKLDDFDTLVERLIALGDLSSNCLTTANEFTIEKMVEGHLKAIEEN